MRKAKESADMLRSVVLPLETEITSLRSRSSTSEKRIKELEKIIDEVNERHSERRYSSVSRFRFRKRRKNFGFKRRRRG